MTADFNITDLVRQGYTKEHAEAWLAMRNGGPPLIPDPPLPAPNFYPADGPSYASQPAASPPAVPAPRTSRRGRPALPPVDQASPAVVRAWAAEAGVKVGATGRIPGSVLRQYERARTNGARV